MQSFKQFISESEDYLKLSDGRKAELIKYHENMSKEHSEKSKEHKKVKAGEHKSFEHNIAAEAHRDAAGLHHSVAYGLKNPATRGYDDTHDIKVRAELMTKAANGRSNIANK